MDSDCDYLLYSKSDEKSQEDEVDYKSCPHCFDHAIQEKSIRCTAIHNTPNVSFDQALTGRMVPYVEVFEVTDQSTWTECKLFAKSQTPLRYVKDGKIISLQGAIHMQDVSPNGTWLSEKTECRKSVLRLRLAGLMCIHLPELNRIVLEQKNDDGLLYLANKWLSTRKNMNEGIELFGPFVCDAMLAPVLHKILRSDWIEERKELGETNNKLKLGWAQEFYDWKCVMKNRTGSTVFVHNLKCPIKSNNVHSYRIVTLILDKMRWCGFTPWSAVQAVRCLEVRISRITCAECKSRLLTSCVFLMECAAVEASRQRDWLVRNEAVIQLCWLLYQIHKPQGCDVEKLLEAWTESTMIHSIMFQEYKVKGALSDLEALVVIFANDHLPFVSENPNDAMFKQRYDNGSPAPELLEVIRRNDRFSPKREPAVYPIAREDDFNISTAVDVLTKAPDAMEARAQEVQVIARALVSCFPRVAASALDDLTLKAPNTRKFSGRIWPVFVNPTRACYQLFKALALPVSPSPVYTLELLARGWRCITHEVFKRFIPMSTGGVVKVSYEHYTKHLMGPLNTLVNLSLISESERDLMIEVLSKGVLPCFAGEGDSVPDRLVSSTIALAFAACGLRVFGFDKDDNNGAHRTVTSAGLLYFAAWYVLVYMGTLHMQPTLKKRLSRTGSDADKHLCAALNLERVTEGSDDYKVVDYNGREILQALRIVFGDLLDIGTILRIAELYVPELLAQLPYTKKLNWIPGSVKSAIESRDVWFTKEHGDKSYLEHTEPPFTYLGNLAHGLHSSIEGTLTRCHARPIAQALHGPDSEFDPWCDSLWVFNEDQDGIGIDDTLRMAISTESEEIFVILDQEEVPLSRESRTSAPKGSLSPDLHPQSSEDKAPAPPEQHDATSYRHICKGLLVENIDKLGFRDRHRFLTMLHSHTALDKSQRVSAPVIKNPCMANIASTVYMKTQDRVDMRSQDKVDITRYRNSHHTLINALWVLFMRSKTSQVATAGVASTATAAPVEPSTPEALAVMVHLAVKSFNPEETGTPFGVCNDIKAMYTTACYEEAQFIPITAIVGGLFGVNVELNVNGCNYYIVNDHYHGLWAPGSICYNSGVWSVMVEGLPVAVDIPKETGTSDCYHVGTLGAYMRLNHLKVCKVLSDDYCGFHTVDALLEIGPRDHGDPNVRKLLVDRTAEYIIKCEQQDIIKVYLSLNSITNLQGLTCLLMEEKRWLHIEEVTFMLKAYDKVPAAITENSYPIYNPEFTHFLLNSCHYEPVMHV